MLCFNVGIENIFLDGALQKSEGGMKEYERESFGIYASWIDRI